MTPPVEVVTVGATRWGQRHPRLVAVGVSLIAGTAVASIMSNMSHGTAPDSNALSIFLMLERTFVPATSFWAFVLFGSRTRRAGGGPWLAMLCGVACVMLAIATIALFDTQPSCSRFDLLCWLAHTNSWTGTWFEIYLMMIVSFFAAFMPQVVGAIGGGVIWLLTRAP